VRGWWVEKARTGSEKKKQKRKRENRMAREKTEKYR
jgi:hypothetical protein